MQDETRKPARGKRADAATTVRPVLSFRAQPELYARVKNRSEASGRAVSEELERLVMLALEFADRQDTEFVIRTVGTAIKLAEMTTGKKWSNDSDTAVMVHSAIESAGRIVLFPHTEDNLSNDIAEKAAKAGVLLGPRAVGMYCGLTVDEILKIGESEVLNYEFAAAQRRAREIAADILQSPSASQDAELIPKSAPEPPEPILAKPRRRAKPKA